MEGDTPQPAEQATERIPIAVMDDHPVTLKGMHHALDNGRYQIVVSACDGEDYIRKSKGHRVALALVDLRMPRMDGCATIAWMREQQPWVRALAYTFDDDPHAVMRAMRSGARGVVLKSAALPMLRRAMDDVHERGFHLNELTERYLRAPHAAEGKAPPPKPHELLKTLSPREHELFDWALKLPQRTYEEFALHKNLSLHTVETFRKSMMEKLGLKNRTELVRFALQHGLVPPGGSK